MVVSFDLEKSRTNAHRCPGTREILILVVNFDMPRKAGSAVPRLARFIVPRHARNIAPEILID